MWVALTISPKLFENIGVNELHNIYFRRYLSRIKVIYILYPEIDLKGRLHYHGVIERNELNIKDYTWSIKFLTNWCFICVKEIKNNGSGNAGKWLKYCRKDWKITKKLIKIKKPIDNMDASKYQDIDLYTYDFINRIDLEKC